MNFNYAYTIPLNDPTKKIVSSNGDVISYQDIVGRDPVERGLHLLLPDQTWEYVMPSAWMFDVEWEEGTL